MLAPVNPVLLCNGVDLMTQKMYQDIIAEIRKSYHDIHATDEEKIKEVVAKLLSKLTSDGKISYPLPVVRLLKQMGFGLFRTNFKNPEQSGLIAVDSSLPEKNKLFKTDRIVLVNNQDSTAHQRFTIAHELAHYIFHFDEATQPTYYKAYLTSEKTDDAELLANRFAAELLMPTTEFKKLFNQYKTEQGETFSLPNTITYLSQQFDAPVTAVKRRLVETGCIEGE